MWGALRRRNWRRRRAEVPDRSSVFLGQIFEVEEILGAALRPLHLPKSTERADLDRYAEQIAVDSVLGQLRVAGDSPRPLDDVQRPEFCVGGDVPPPPDHSAIGRWVEAAAISRGQRRLELGQ